eukprot:15365743-Ditylum_brightwellii.AAC.1
MALSMQRYQNAGSVLVETSSTVDIHHHRGALFAVQSASLARRIADTLQIPTQNVASKGGRMLASSALIIGTNEYKIFQNNSSSNNNNINKVSPTNSIWRIDPTGQFWNCDAAAIGKHAGRIEATFMRRIATWKEQQQQQQQQKENNNKDDDNEEKKSSSLEEIVASLSNQDVQEYLNSLSCQDGLGIACRCIMDSIMSSEKQRLERTSLEEEDLFLQGVVLRCSSSSCVEVVNGDQLRQILLQYS